MIIVHEDQVWEIMIDTVAKQLTTVVKLRSGDRITRYDAAQFINLMTLSEHFRDEVGLGLALQILTDNKIDSDSPLWTLGAKGGDTHAPRP